MKKLPLLFLLLLGISSCQVLLLKLYGIRKPKVENRKSISGYAHRIGLDTAGILTVNSKDFLRVLAKRGIPDGAVYDSRGKYIEYRQTDTSCNAGLFQFIPALDTALVYHQPDSASLFTEWQKFRTLDGGTPAYPGKADFYLLLYWTAWTGKLNKDHVKIWEDLARNNTKSNIRVIKVNLDLQSYWTDAERERIINVLEKSAKK